MGEAARLRPFETPKAPLFTSRYLTPETKGQGRRDLPRETTQAESALLQGRFVIPLERREEPPSHTPRALSQVPCNLLSSLDSTPTSATTGGAVQSVCGASSSVSPHLLFFRWGRGETGPEQ